MDVTTNKDWVVQDVSDQRVWGPNDISDPYIWETLVNSLAL